MPSLPFLLVYALFAVPTVSISVYPMVAMAPNSYRLRVIVDRNAENRGLCYGYDGPEFKQSCVAINGEKDAAVWTKYVFIRTSGEYDAFADLTRIEGGKEQHYRTRQAFKVIGMEF